MIIELIAHLESALAEAEEEKGGLQLRLMELEDVAVSEQKLKARVLTAEEGSRYLPIRTRHYMSHVNIDQSEHSSTCHMTLLTNQNTALYFI